ncbi:ATP-binding cassette domain-containing protein [Lysinibacillus sp. NPDC094403]|uniref:ATP-binding cassette domain-containing protein n=1 Tax=Lysinibacillus sp. NPDC094403 TaxID=3390581 RepID=UPI003CFD80F4
MRKGRGSRLNQGAIDGLIGRNGAGKTTLMKIITQTIQTYERSVADNHQVGYMIEEPKILSSKTGLFHLTYFLQVYPQFHITLIAE